jgi:Leucine-rich repeat (LRR) protein
MKNSILLWVLIFTSNCNSQIVYFGSEWIKANILATNTTTNLRAKDLNGNWLKIDQNEDGEVQVSEALNVSYYFDAGAIYVSSYEGMNSFLNLESLTFSYNQTSASLDLSGLNNLTYLNCYDNNLTSINLNGCNSLEFLFLNQNYLTTLDLSGLQNLKLIECQNNFLTTLNVNSTPNLTDLFCFNNYLTSLNLDDHNNLESLNCINNSLINLTLNNCQNLKELKCHSNNLQTLNLNILPNLEYLICANNNLQTLDASNCPFLTYLNCNDNQLISLNINNGYNWVPSYDNSGSFRGINNIDINEVCTSTSSVASLLSYYSPFTTNVSNCSVLNVNGNENESSTLIFYPNPARDKIFFSKDLNLVSVYDLNGLLIKEDKINNREMNVSDLTIGLYILKVQSENDTKSHKLIIK